SKLPRPTALAKVTGLTDYGDDVALKMPEGAAQLAVVMPDVSHAKIKSVDISAAEAMPGVFKVLTAKDVQGTNNLEMPVVHPRKKGAGITPCPVIAGDKIRHKGDIVAVVCADTREHAREAAKAVKYDLDVLPAYLTFPEAAMPDAVQLYDDQPNVFMWQPVFKGEDPEDIFPDADVVVEGSFHSQHEPHLPIEPDVLQGYWDEDDNLVLQCKCQAIGECRDEIAPACGIEKDKLRIILNPIGGAFGYPVNATTFGVVATAVQTLGIPCTMTLNYEEFLFMTGKRSASFTNGKLACNKDGKIVAAEYDLGLDAGCYAMTASKILGNFASVAFHGYNIPSIKALVRGGTTNQNFCAPYRGFGSPQIYTASEALIDMAAEAAGIDPWEFRYINCAREGDKTINSMPYKQYPYPKLLEMIKPYYDEYKKLAEQGKAEGRHVGVGISLGGFLCTIGMFDQSEVALELNPDGTITNYNTWEDMGQGGDVGALVHTVKALAPMGVKASQIRLVQSDWPKCPDSGQSAASRQHYMTGNAIIDGANKLMDAMRKPDGTYRTYDEMVAEGIPTKYIGHYDQANLGLPPGLDPNTGMGDKDAEYMYAVNTCLVEVDVNTGKTQVLKYTTACDVGVVGNMLSVEGQAFGGLSHSIGFALSENYEQTPKYDTIVGSGIPTIDAIPDDFNVLFLETPRPRGPQGSSGCSECFQSSGHMAVINAINNACGVRVYALPATPDKVKAGWEKLQKGEDLTPEPYFLGSELDDELELIKANPI
ncbi:MAG: xanthine dehydrogenase family protein, partial [Oscillospiraceae bacterium]|nr:xanthine dehydrogenase family protein [Oscillospiraceae bacterium]